MNSLLVIHLLEDDVFLWFARCVPPVRAGGRTGAGPHSVGHLMTATMAMNGTRRDVHRGPVVIVFIQLGGSC